MVGERQGKVLISQVTKPGPGGGCPGPTRAPPSALASVHGLSGHETPEGCVSDGVGRGAWSSESLCCSSVCDQVFCLIPIRLRLCTDYCFKTFRVSTFLYVTPLEQYHEP